MHERFFDRREAGRRLGERLLSYAGRPDVRVLGLPRGGVPVAFQVAQRLQVPLDVHVVRKLGVARHPELAMAAIASGGVLVLNHRLVDRWAIPPEDIDRAALLESEELARRTRAYRGGRAPLNVKGCTAIVVDDGLASGITMRAAVAGLRHAGAHRIVVAVPIGTGYGCIGLSGDADEVVCMEMPVPFRELARWYRNFPQVEDHEVRDLLDRAAGENLQVDEIFT
ncbi:MAG TPA: phosphoribosyltransferase [Aromatoleum sp.]|uniref:phosphoribosyltransferase n=1 Tax=Aromatoleum sp. TaxID=2307007 RepID=UPI002B4614E7|nr:phosphoribosyltransferase [Aromatoleum sp.]HJV24041.1 phosphoribosyltransferase [Aromatoleum sp.]